MVSKGIAALVLLFLCVSIWLTQSRGALVAVFLMGFAWWVLSKEQKGKNKQRVAVFFFIAIPLLLSFFIFRTEGDLNGSQSSRLNYVLTGLRMLKSSPLVGIGLDQYPELYESFTYSFEEYGKRTAHSSWVLAFSESGLLGFGLYLAIFIFSFIDAMSIRKNHPEYLLALIGYGVTMSLLSHTYLFLPYLILSLIHI